MVTCRRTNTTRRFLRNCGSLKAFGILRRDEPSPKALEFLEILRAISGPPLRLSASTRSLKAFSARSLLISCSNCLRPPAGIVLAMSACPSVRNANIGSFVLLLLMIRTARSSMAACCCGEMSETNSGKLSSSRASLSLKLVGVARRPAN
jgi:hypothetical protein